MSATQQLPRIQLVRPTRTSPNPTALWDSQEYEQLCFDLLQEAEAAKGTENSDGTNFENRQLAILDTTTDSSRSQVSTRIRATIPDRTIPPGPRDNNLDPHYFRRQRTTSQTLPSAKKWCGQFTCAYVEILNGNRPLRQLERWLSLGVAQHVKSEIIRISRNSQFSLQVHSLHVSEPTDSVIEGSCVVKENQSFKAMTFRFEGWDNKWICTHLQLH